MMPSSVTCRLGLILAAPLWISGAARGWSQEVGDAKALAQQASAVLKRLCYDCHGGRSSQGNPDLDVMDVAGLAESDADYLIRGKPDESYFLQRMVDREMPPENKPQPTDEELELLRQWILAGAPSDRSAPRTAIGEREVLTAIRDDLRGRPEFDRRFLRYFTFNHLHNNSELSELQLRLFRAALSKAINSLAWQPTIVPPAAVDEGQSVFRIDLRELGWDAGGEWSAILAAYPYGLTHDQSADPALRELYRDVVRESGAPLAYVRADWFVAVATRPPLYYRLLDLPESAGELERRLDVDVAHNFHTNRAVRIGLPESGVSKQNRLLERHPAQFGAYWVSYDFLSEQGRGSLPRFPLGPAFPTNRFAEHAFQHAGGELIFNLPNGLQGYLLVDDKGARIDEGPVEIVEDSQALAGSSVIVNGLSCMGCHRHGIIPARDAMRDGCDLLGEPLEKVQQLYRPQAEVDALIARDARRFLTALHEAIAPFVMIDEDAQRPLEEFAEPVGAVVKFYLRNLSLNEAACELAIEPERLKAALELQADLRGLKPLAGGFRISRASWESREHAVSPAQRAARVLGLGSPYIEIAGH